MISIVPDLTLIIIAINTNTPDLAVLHDII